MNKNLSIWEQEGTLAAAFWKNGKLDFPVYDMHGHMGSHNAIYMENCEVDAMAEHLRRAGVKHLVFSHHHALHSPEFRNRDAWNMIRNQDGLFRLYLAINPNFPATIREDLAAFDEFSPLVIGLKFLADYHHVKVTDKPYEAAFEFAEARSLPILFHTWGGSPYDGADVMLEAVKRYPHVKFFLGHSFSGDATGVKRLHEASPDNTWFELTSLPGQRGVIERIVRDAGADRILYGTDLPWFDEFQGIGGVLSAKISDAAKKAILCDNAEAIFGKNW